MLDYKLSTMWKWLVTIFETSYQIYTIKQDKLRYMESGHGQSISKEIVHNITKFKGGDLCAPWGNFELRKDHN